MGWEGTKNLHVAPVVLVDMGCRGFAFLCYRSEVGSDTIAAFGSDCGNDRSRELSISFNQDMTRHTKPRKLKTLTSLNPYLMIMVISVLT